MNTHSATKKTLLVVYHTMTGGTEQMVQAFARGARTEPEIRVRLVQAPQVTVEDVLNAQALVFATPENLAAMSGLLKDFFDRTYYGVLDQTNARPYGIMICAGSDGDNAARQIERIATGWRLRLVQPAIVVNTQAQTPEAILAPKHLSAAQLAPCEEFGALFAAGLAMSIY